MTGRTSLRRALLSREPSRWGSSHSSTSRPPRTISVRFLSLIHLAIVTSLNETAETLRPSAWSLLFPNTCLRFTRPPDTSAEPFPLRHPMRLEAPTLGSMGAWADEQGSFRAVAATPPLGHDGLKSLRAGEGVLLYSGIATTAGRVVPCVARTTWRGLKSLNGNGHHDSEGARTVCILPSPGVIHALHWDAPNKH